MSGPSPALSHGAAISLDHVGIVGADLDLLSQVFEDLGFRLTPFAAHASGRTGNRRVMLRDGGYLELMATVPGKSSATLDRFLARGAGAHVLALEVANEAAALDRLRRAGVAAGEVSITERDAGPDGTRSSEKARFALIMPPDPPEGRILLIRHLTRDLLWRPDKVVHPNRAVALTEAVYATDTPAETMTRLSRLAGRPAEPDPLGGYRIPLGRGCVRILPRARAEVLFPGAASARPLIGLTIAAETLPFGNRGTGIQPGTLRPEPAALIVHAGGVAIRFTVAPD